MQRTCGYFCPPLWHVSLEILAASFAMLIYSFELFYFFRLTILLCSFPFEIWPKYLDIILIAITHAAGAQQCVCLTLVFSLRNSTLQMLRR